MKGDMDEEDMGEGEMGAGKTGTDEASHAVATSNAALRWESADSPSIMSNDLVYNLSELPLSGEVTSIPWPGSYWPTFQDSINYRWAGDDVESAVEKFSRAFDIAGLDTRVSEYSGILSQRYGTSCTSDSECNSGYGEACAKRRGESEGYCIPTWFGLCHAWSPASILEPEPIMAVAKNDVTFRVNDLKALLTLAYNQVTTRFVSLRCNESNGRGEIEYDRYGRPTGSDTECRDTNPGTFHVLMTNYLGLRKLAFVEDRIFDDQVWNQPLRGYDVLEQREVTAREANTLVGATGGETITMNGMVVRSTWSHLGDFAVQPGEHVSVKLTGTGDADLYVRFGAQPTTRAYHCRPYLDGTNETCDLVVPENTSRVYVSVRGYALFSTFTAEIGLGDGALDQYQFNPDATRFYYVKSNLKYIYESGSSDDGNLSNRIDEFTGIDTYEYLLELDNNNRIIGGEWLNQSKTGHPDFLWLPVERAPTSDAPIDYTRVKELLNESVGQVPGTQFVTVHESGTLVPNQWVNYGPFNVAGGSLRAVMTGTNDADLYVRRGAPPTAEEFDCRPYIDGTGENCELAGSGPVYVSVAGYAPSSDFALDITYLTKP